MSTKGEHNNSNTAGRLKQNQHSTVKLAERGGDSTTQSKIAQNIDLTAFTDTAFSADSANSAVFSRILEQILEQEK